MINLMICGACGRMGQTIGRLATQDEQFHIVAAIESSGHPDLGKNFGKLIGDETLSVKVAETCPSPPHVVIDFSLPAGTFTAIEQAKQHKAMLVVGTTGLEDQHHRALDKLATEVAVVQSANMSVGVNLLFVLAGRVAEALGRDYDVEIVEWHHRRKRDAPSGTALQLARAVCKDLDKDPDETIVSGRKGPNALREPGSIGISAVRGGDIAGEHTVMYAAESERVELRHVAHSRETFARGALRAAKWIVGQSPGRYTMADVLGLG